MKKELRRSKDKKLAGVCGGIAEYFGWDPTIVRLAYLLLSVFTGAAPGFLAYIILWIVMPEASE